MDEKLLLSKIEAFVEQNKENIIQDIGKLVAIRSVEEAPEEGAPFGKGPANALKAALQMAQDMGFETYDGDGYVGWFEVEGQNSGHIATITHVDVVPEGEGWDGEPYVMRRHDGWLLGRGVGDDKGPSVLCLYLAKFYKELGLSLPYGLRILFGTNEETGMKDVEYYLSKNEEPLFCFTPDSDFPVSYGEKGHLNGVFTSQPLNGNIVEFAGGVANNVIPDRATCLVKGDAAALQNTERVLVSEENGMVRLNAKGVGGHAAGPQGSVNAIGLLVEYLLQNKLGDADETAFLQLLHNLHSNPFGANIDIACEDDVFGSITMIGGIIKLEDGRLKQYTDSRFPTAMTGKEISERLNKQAQAAGGTFEAVSIAEPFYIPKDSDLIQVLWNVYNEVTGDETEPFTMGGGTYARHFAKAVSFGPGKRGAQMPSFAGPAHGANEGANEEQLLQALKIYILAVWKLQQLDLENS